MEIILLEKIQNLGDLGDTVKVANGYARNFLIPQKKAMLATTEAKARVEDRRRQLADEESNRIEVAKARADLGLREITVTRLVGETGKLYGSVSPSDIAEAMDEAGCRIEKSEIFQPDGPIKQTGEFTAVVILHPEVRFEVKVIVVGEGQNFNPPPPQPEISDAAELATEVADAANPDDAPQSGA